MTWAGVVARPPAAIEEYPTTVECSEKPLKYQKLAPLIVDRSADFALQTRKKQYLQS